MDTLTRFLRTSKIVGILVLLSSCGYTEDEKAYIGDLKMMHPNMEFHLSDRLTGLELTVDIKDSRMDSTAMITLFGEMRKPLKKYEKIKWVYVIVTSGSDQLGIIRKTPDGKIVFIKDRDR